MKGPWGTFCVEKRYLKKKVSFPVDVCTWKPKQCTSEFSPKVHSAASLFLAIPLSKQ